MDQIADLYDSPRNSVQNETRTQQAGPGTEDLLRSALERIHTLEIQLQHERDMRRQQQGKLQQQQQQLHTFQRDGQHLAQATVQLANHVHENQRRQTQEEGGQIRSDGNHSGVGNGGLGVGARHNEPHINGAAQHAAPQPNRFKVNPPKPFDGKTLDDTALESWLYQMNLYFSIKTSLPENLRVPRAALLLTGNAATWFQAQGWDPTAISWQQLQSAMRQTFKPVDNEYRARDRLRQCQQTGSVIDYTAAFRARLLECSNVSDAEALDRYVAGLKPTMRDWVLIHDPTTMHQAAKWAERYDNTYFSKSRNAASTSAQPRQTSPPGRRQQPWRSSAPSRKPYQQQQSAYRQQPPPRQQQQQTQGSPQGQNQSQENRRFPGQCYICGRAGHKASECRMKPNGVTGRSNHLHGQQQPRRGSSPVEHRSGNE